MYDVKIEAGTEHIDLHTFSNGMPYFFRIEGEIKVILWRRKASQLCAFPGKKPARNQHRHEGPNVLRLVLYRLSAFPVRAQTHKKQASRNGEI